MRGADLSGQILDGRYQIVERLAEGAMGVVYRATRLKLDRAVAIKVMHGALPGAMEGRKRFEREAKLMAKLEHPHCVSIIDYGVQGDKPYVVMELVRGHSLHDMLAEQGRFELARAVDIMQQILSGLAHAHEQNIIHRDIKPANVMITPKAPLGLHARILDFGLARLLGASTSLSDGLAVGTPSYMAPEQVRGEVLDARVDLYACGVMLFEMVTGKKPFTAADPIAILRQHVEQPPPRIGDVIPGDWSALESVVARALAKRPADRYASAVAMSEALAAALSGRAHNERTAEFAHLGSSALVPVAGSSADAAPAGVATTVLPAPARAAGEASVEVPITIGSSVVERAGNRAGNDSSIRKLLPVSRTRWLVLALLCAAVGAVAAAIVMSRDDDSTAPVVPPVHADAAIADASIADAPPDPDAQRAAAAFSDGKQYFAKLWWTDGIASFRKAFAIDPALRKDPELLRLAVRAFVTTPSYDDALASFVLELRPDVMPELESTAHKHPNAVMRSRAQALLARAKR